jgi:hypothetical protein
MRAFFQISNTCLHRIIALVITIGLLSACTAPQQVKGSAQPPQQVEPLTQVSPPTSPGLSPSSQPLEAVMGQTVYVPAYSHVYYGKGEEYLLAITLSIRNTSLTDTISVKSVRYYDSKGKLVKEFSPKSLQIAPMATSEFFVEERDTSGGSGANFIVEWDAVKTVSAPVIEVVMISTAFQQGISFISPGRVIAEKSK